MTRLLQSLVALLFATQLLGSPASAQSERWMTLPPTPSLPTPASSGKVEVNGASIWYAVFGPGVAGRAAAWRARQLELLGQPGAGARRSSYQVIVIDSRGHGRSTRSAAPYGYELMASDVLGVMDKLGIKKAAIVGWSDGAIIGLGLAMNHPDRVARLFAFAANSDPSGVKDVDKSPVFTAVHRPRREGIRGAVADAQGYKQFVEEISAMWARQPNWTKADLARSTCRPGSSTPTTTRRSIAPTPS